MRDKQAIDILKWVALAAIVVAIVGAVAGAGSLSRAPSSVSHFVSQLMQGHRDGMMGLVIVAVLVAPPLAMLSVAFGRASTNKRHLWIAFATVGVLVVSGVVAVLGN